MGNWFLKELCDRNRSMMPLDKGLHIYYLLQRALKAKGAVVEFGCYRGYSALLMAKSCDREIHVYDSFEGLPEKGEQDVALDEATMRKCDRLDNKRVGKGWFASKESELHDLFASYEVTRPVVHKGWFEELDHTDIPEKIAFAHIDGDFYSSTLAALKLVYPRLSSGGIIVIDDYCDPTIHERQNQFPGVKRACDDFFCEETVTVLPCVGEYQGYVTRS